MDRATYIERVNTALEGRKLVWVGTRGHDAQALLDIPLFSEVFSVAAPLGSVSVKTDLCLESLTQRRENLDSYTLDDDTSEPAMEIRARLYESLGSRAAVAAYRPLNLISSICYPRSKYVRYLGTFHERQWPFEHKPWVENELRQQGVNVIPWTYYTDHHEERLKEELECRGALVLRANRSDGGMGLSIVSNASEIREKLPRHRDGYIGAAPLLMPHVPLNVNACVFSGGEITMHGPSCQLIGLQACTSRAFGYCGNDFGAIRDLPQDALRALDGLVRKTGRWMSAQGYVGAFGVDAMLYDGGIYIVEVNPRFQGSSMLSARIDRRIGRCDLYLCHLAAFLGVDPPVTGESLLDIAASQPPCAQIIFHNRGDSDVHVSGAQEWGCAYDLELLPHQDVGVRPEAILCRAVFQQHVTTNGWTLVNQEAIALAKKIDMAVCAQAASSQSRVKDGDEVDLAMQMTILRRRSNEKTIE